MDQKTIEELIQELLTRIEALEQEVAELKAATVKESGRVGA